MFNYSSGNIILLIRQEKAKIDLGCVGAQCLSKILNLLAARLSEDYCLMSHVARNEICWLMDILNVEVCSVRYGG